MFNQLTALREEIEMNWILIIFIHAGVLSQGDSMTMFSVPNFKDEASCSAAGKASESLVSATKKSLRFVCVPQQKP